jgi:predicted nucleic acid-binding protein
VYVLDTNVLSELRRSRPHGGVLAWIGGLAPTELFVAAVTMGEIQAGIEATRRQDPLKAAEIEVWADLIEQTFTVLPVDGASFRIWVKLMNGRSGDLSEDAMIAAVALVNRMTVATRNVRDFEGFGVGVVNPFRDMPKN